MLAKVVGLAFPGSHDDAYVARLQFSTALYHEAKKFHVVCK